MASLVFLAGVSIFLSSYSDARVVSKERDFLLDQVALLRKNARELRRKKNAMEQVKSFISNAKNLGLEKKDWKIHSVNINEDFYFDDAATILGQTSNSSLYYFKPKSLYIKRISEEDPEQKKKGKQDGDLSITLRGTFLVRQK